MPCQVKIIDDGPKVLVPVEMFGQSECVLGVHFHGGNVLVEDVHCDVCWEVQIAYFISELVYFSQIVSEGHCHLR